mgnify:CR=1 FL=1
MIVLREYKFGGLSLQFEQVRFDLLIELLFNSVCRVTFVECSVKLVFVFVDCITTRCTLRIEYVDVWSTLISITKHLKAFVL